MQERPRCKEAAMVSGQEGTEPSPPEVLAGSWQTALFLGVATFVLGLIVSLHPSGSVDVIAVLLGVLTILSGVFHLIRVFDREEPHRVWLGIAGLLFIVIGVVLIRHLHLTRSIIGLIIGIAGIAVTATPTSSLNVLATVLGIWFIVMGVFEIVGALLLRHALRTTTLTHA